jgi:hypothetical protein
MDARSPPRDGPSGDTRDAHDSGTVAKDSADDRSPMPDASSTGGIPSTMFSLTLNHAFTGIQVKFNSSRIWDDYGSQQPDVYQCPSVPEIPSCQANPSSATSMSWTGFDSLMSDLKSAGADQIMYTLWRIPGWAVNVADDPERMNGTDCDYYDSVGMTGVLTSGAPGQCLWPVDLNADGSGANAIWKTFITRIAQHVNDASWKTTHAHIERWEVCNECYRSSTTNPGWKGSKAFEGTFAQLLRMTEDLRCILTGKGTIHNFPSVGDATPCALAPIDPTAVIVASAGAPTTYAGPVDWYYNFLYCNHSPPSGTHCNWDGLAWGSEAVDIMNLHGSGDLGSPEQFYETFWPGWQSGLSSTDKAKPLMCGECSYNNPTVNWMSHYDQAAFIPRWFSLETTYGFTFNNWYAYDVDTDGALADKTTETLLEPTADAWALMQSTLLGAQPAQTPFCQSSGTVWTCKLKKSGGYVGALVWDAQYGPLGKTPPSSCADVICGTTSFPVDVVTYNTGYVTMDGVKHPASTSITIGAVPVLLEGS